MVRRMYRRYDHPAGPRPPASDYVRRWMDRVLDVEPPPKKAVEK